MTYSVKYIKDSKGRERAVQVSMRDWRKIEKKIQEAEFLTRVRKDIDEGFEEIRQYQHGKKKLKTLEELLGGM